MVEALRESEFPVTHECAYLDHATFGPLPASNVRAATEALAALSRPDATALGGTALLDSVRSEAATMLHCEPARVALLKSTSEGLGLLAQGLDWGAGDEVIVHADDFWGCLAPFVDLKRLGLRLRFLPNTGAIETLVTPRTRAVVLSMVDRATGTRAPVEAIGALCRERGLWYALDAAQALGVSKVDALALGADIVAAHGYKFLASGFGVALTYCSPRALEQLRVPQVGWKNSTLTATESSLLLEHPETAERFESTMPSLPVLAGMAESLRLLNSVDDVVRQRRAVALIQSVADELRRRGFEVVSSAEPDEASALVCARHRVLPAEAVARDLRAAGVAVGVADDCFRVSAHFYNTADDTNALLAALPTG